MTRHTDMTDTCARVTHTHTYWVCDYLDCRRGKHTHATALHRHTTCQLVLATCHLMQHVSIHTFFAPSHIQIDGVVMYSGGAAKAVTQSPSIADGT